MRRDLIGGCRPDPVLLLAEFGHKLFKPNRTAIFALRPRMRRAGLSCNGAVG